MATEMKKYKKILSCKKEQGESYEEYAARYNTIVDKLNENTLESMQKYLHVTVAIIPKLPTSELDAGYVKITGVEGASDYVEIVKESDLQAVGKRIYAKHPGADGYYDFLKYLWVEFPDDRPDTRLNEIVPL